MRTLLRYYISLDKDLNYQTSNIVDISLPAMRLKPLDPAVTAGIEEDITLSPLSLRFSLCKKSPILEFLLSRILKSSLVLPFSVIIVLLMVSFVSLFTLPMLTIFECASLVVVDDDVYEDDIRTEDVLADVSKEGILLLFMLLLLTFILDMADDDDDVSNDRGNT